MKEVFFVTQEKVDYFMMTNQKYFATEKAMYVREKLLALPDEQMALVTTVDLKDPTTMLLISLFLGSLGVDRFMLGDTGMGVLKLLTLGVCGVLTIIDWFSIMNKTKEMNFNNLMMRL